jgi:Rad3-related DNA helicase
MIFPKCADERDDSFRKHTTSPDPTILVSPSMTEGFDFADELARWQIIAKMPYPYLGDRQVAAKKEQDPAWYDAQTVGTIIQTTGRIVRSETDKGVTYILDSDFMFLWEKRASMFPRWWRDGIVWGKSGRPPS